MKIANTCSVETNLMDLYYSHHIILLFIYLYYFEQVGRLN